jgi:zinc protease
MPGANQGVIWRNLLWIGGMEGFPVLLGTEFMNTYGNGLARRLAAMALAGVVLAAGGFAARGDTAEGDILRETLTNGLRVIIVRNPLAPVVSTVINYQVGSDEAPAGFPGMAHAQEHMMFRGAPELNAGQLANLTAALGGDFNADTQQMLTQYFFTAPAENVDLLLRIEAIRMRGVLDTDKLWGQERGAIEQEVAQDLSNPEYLLYMKLLQALFAGTPYDHDALGTRPSFDKTTGAMLKQFYTSWYAPNNAILVVVGDIDPAKTMDIVRREFGAIPTKTLPARPEFNFQPVKPDKITLESDLPYGLVAISFRMPGSDSPDYAATQILSDVLSSQRGKLYQLVPDGKALYAGFSVDTLPKAGIGYAIGAYPSEGDGNALLGQIWSVLEGELTNGVSAELVEAAKRREVISVELQRNSVSGLAMDWSDAVAAEGRNSPADDIDAIRRVTVDDVNRVARQFLDTNQAITAILTPRPSGKPVSSQGFGGKETFTPKQAGSVKLPQWAQRALDKVEAPVSGLSPVVSKLPNGLTVIVQPENISGTVSVFGRVKANPQLQAPSGREGVSRALDELFSYGTKTLDRLAFQKALDDIGASESAGTNFSVQVLTNDFDRGVQLLADNVISPALPGDAFKIIQPEMAEAVAGEMESPGYQAGVSLRRALYPTNDPALRRATPDTIKALSIDDIRGFHQQLFRPDMTTIVVIGAVTSDDALSVVTKYFGNWHADGPQPETLLAPVSPNAPSKIHVPDASRIQDDVTLAETTGLTRTNADYYKIQLGNHILGGAFYATRFYQELREKRGLVYFVDSSFSIGLSRGLYEVSYGCDPPNVDRARTIVVGLLKGIQKKNVTAAELRQAKALLMREIPLGEESVDGVAGSWLTYTIMGLPLNEPTLAAQKYLNLNADDVREAFKKWVRPDDLVQLVQGP